MSSANFTQTAEQLSNSLADAGVDVPADELEAEMEAVQNEYGLPEREVIRTVKGRHAENTESTVEALGGSGNDIIAIGDIEEVHAGDGTWVDIKAAQVMGTWTVDHGSIAQKAEIADKSGRCQVTIWDNGGSEPTLEEGDTIGLNNVPTDEYQGNYSVNITSASSVESVDVEVEPDDGHVEVGGQLVTIKDGSGLIKRCGHEDCSRALQQGSCSEHGDVDGEFDLRLKAVIDDGEVAEDVLFGREATEDLLDITLDGAVKEAMDAMEMTLVEDQAQDELVGSMVRVSGPEYYGNIYADEFGFIQAVSRDEVEDALVEARQAGL